MKQLSAEKAAEREAAKLREAIHRFAEAYDKTDENLLGSFNPRDQKWQIKVLNRACEILDDQAVLLHSASNGNGKKPVASDSFIPDHIIEPHSAFYRDVTPDMRAQWHHERNAEIQQRIDQAFERGRELGKLDVARKTFWQHIQAAFIGS